jgi:hypothetical protein
LTQNSLGKILGEIFTYSSGHLIERLDFHP